MKILMTGGHAGTTGLSLIEEIKKRNPQVDIEWIGVGSALSGSKSNTIEYKIYPKYGVKFYSIDAGKIQTKFTEHTISLLLKIPSSFLKAFLLVFKIKPNLILSFGGSVSYPVILAGKLLRTPVIIHEQTTVTGRANLFGSKFADLIAISHESSRKYFKNKNVVLTGNPISPEINNLVGKKRNQVVRNILITGGSRGSTWINNAVTPLIPELLKKYNISWQVGEANISNIKIRNPRLRVFGQIDPKNMIKEIFEADFVISRAGANTISELVALKKPSILIPIPWSFQNEQVENAKYMERSGLAIVLQQKDLNPANLMSKIDYLIDNYQSILEKTKNVESIDLEASTKLSDLILHKLNEEKEY